MPKKGKKKKGPAIDETPSVVYEHTGFHPHDLICAPFGEQIEVVGVVVSIKKPPVAEGDPSADGADGDDAADDDDAASPREGAETVVKVFGKLKTTGQVVPLRPSSAREFQALGYARVHEAAHIVRDTLAFEARFETLMDSALPKPKKEKKAKKGGGKKKKK